MLRFSGLILICLSVAAAGLIKSEKLRYRVNYLSRLRDFSALAIGEMRGTNDNIFTIFKKLGKKELSFLGQLDVRSILDQKKLFCIIEKAGFEEQDTFVAADFISRLGTGNIDEQAELCRYYSEKFGELLKCAQRDYRDKGKIIISLYISASAALFVILI